MGDVDFKGAIEVASKITPVGGLASVLPHTVMLVGRACEHTPLRFKHTSTRALVVPQLVLDLPGSSNGDPLAVGGEKTNGYHEQSLSPIN